MTSYKVAVASIDGKFVDQHFGKAEHFFIFEVDDNGDHQLIELRETAPRCGGSDELKEKTLDIISDCEVLLVNQIGPGAARKLINRGVKTLILYMSIEDALKEVSLYQM